jgi:magnesium transporter
MQIDAYIVTEDRALAPVDAREMSDDWFLDDTVRWIKITSAPPPEVERALRPLELPPRIVHACAHPQPPQVEVFEKVYFMDMPVWNRDTTAAPSVRLVCAPTTLITIQDEPVHAIDELAEYLRGDRRLLDASTAALTYDIAEGLHKFLMPIYLTLRRDMETIADKLEETPGEVENEDILSLKVCATRISDLFEDYLFCLEELQVVRSEKLQFAKVRTPFQELVGDFQRGQRIIARMEDRIRDLRQSKLNALQESTNRRLNILAVLSAIYLPSTLIAGIYGMNFEDMPITKLPYGYAIILIVMLGLVIGQVLFFYRRGWFE